MKLVYLSPDFTSPWLSAKYAEALREGGADVEIFSARFPEEDFRKSIVESDSQVRCFENHLHVSSLIRRVPYLWRYASHATTRLPTIRYLAALLGARADIYMAGDPDDLYLAWIAARFVGARLVYAPFEYYPAHSEAGASLTAKWRKLEKRIAPSVAAWISLGDKLSDEYRRVYDLNGRVHTIYSSVPRNFSTGRFALRERIKAAERDKIILYQGLIAKRRGLWDVLDSMQWLPSHVRFAVLGFGPETPEFAEAIRSRHLEQRVHLLDAVPQAELMNYTCDADIGVIPIHNMCESYRYCNPGKLFEFVAAGLPVVVSDLDQLKFYVTERGLGEVFEAGSPQGLAQALLRLVNDDDYRKRCSLNSKRVHESEACWDIQAKKLREAVLSEKNGSLIQSD